MLHLSGQPSRVRQLRRRRPAARVPARPPARCRDQPGRRRGAGRRGNRVVLLDLLGHGRSDKPRHTSAYRMDTYATQVFALLDELGAKEAVLGGMSLGANVSLFAADQHPHRVRGLVLEMPVLEPRRAVSRLGVRAAAHARPLRAAVVARHVVVVPAGSTDPLRASRQFRPRLRAASRRHGGRAPRHPRRPDRPDRGAALPHVRPDTGARPWERPRAPVRRRRRPHAADAECVARTGSLASSSSGCPRDASRTRSPSSSTRPGARRRATPPVREQEPRPAGTPRDAPADRRLTARRRPVPHPAGAVWP